MKVSEKSKVQKIINSIQAGELSEMDVDHIFSYLRGYSYGNHCFREIGDLIAHNNKRDKGTIKDTINHLGLSIKCYLDIKINKKKIGFDHPVPEYYKDFLILQAKKYKIKSIRSGDFEKKIKTAYRKTHGNSSFSLPKEKKIKEAIEHYLSFIAIDTVFKQDQIMIEILDVLTKNKIKLDEDLLLLQKNKIVLCIMLLIHGTEFELTKDLPVKCYLSYINEGTNEFNCCLAVMVGLEIENKNFMFAVFMSNLNVNDWCEEHLIKIKNGQIVHLPYELILNDNFKLDVYSEDGLGLNNWQMFHTLYS